MKTHRLLLTSLLIWAMPACSNSLAENRNARPNLTPGTVQLANEGGMPSLDGAITWLNSPPLSAAICAARSSWSTSGRIPVSIGDGRYPTFARGQKNTGIRAWSSSVCTHLNSTSRKTQITFVRARRKWESTIQSRSIAGGGYGTLSTTNIGRRSILSMCKDAFGITNSARVTTVIPKGSYSSYWQRPETLV